MEKDILVYLNVTPVEYLAVGRTNTILSIKKYLQKYEDVKVQMYIDSKNELKVFDTDKYDDMTLESVWKKMQDSTLVLTSYIQKLTGNKDVDMMILKSLDDASIFNLCKVNKYASELCQKLYTDESFWEHRLKNLTKYWDKPKNISWYEYYKEFFNYETNLCSCNLSKAIDLNKRKILELFYRMEYNQVLNLKETDTSCYCGRCGDEGLRELIQVKKSNRVEVEAYFDEDLDDFVEHENIPGLEFWKKSEKFDEATQKYELRYGEELDFRINVHNKTIELRHYGSKTGCVWPDVCVNNACEYLELALK